MNFINWSSTTHVHQTLYGGQVSLSHETAQIGSDPEQLGTEEPDLSVLKPARVTLMPAPCRLDDLLHVGVLGLPVVPRLHTPGIRV